MKEFVEVRAIKFGRRKWKKSACSVCWAGGGGTRLDVCSTDVCYIVSSHTIINVSFACAVDVGMPFSRFYRVSRMSAFSPELWEQ